MIKDNSEEEISKNKQLKALFLSAKIDSLNITCNILKGDFYADSLSYFPITENFFSFKDLYQWQSPLTTKFFFTKQFYDDFSKNLTNYKKIENVYLLGTSFAENYYTNLAVFLPRIIFNNESQIRLAIHRNLSNQFKDYILWIGKTYKKKITFVFLDNGMYHFKNSLIPQFMPINKTVQILRYLTKTKLDKNKKKSKKIYISRQNTNYRSIVNESDLINFLKEEGFEIINPYVFKIKQQQKIFNSAKIIISATGSNLANIIFCQKGTKIIEIGPNLKNSFQDKKYSRICKLLDLEYYKINTDTVNVAKHSSIAQKYINKQILEESPYYKNLIVKISDIKKFFASI